MVKTSVIALCRSAIFILCVILPQSAWGWSSNLHRAVCEVVWQQLNTTERQWLLEVMQHHDIQNFSTGCAWPDWIREKAEYRHTRGWHYQNFDQPPVKDENCLKGCLLRAIRQNYNLLRTATGQEKAEALYFLAHLVADLHQPLHTGRVSDRGGNDLPVRFQGKEINLHKLWDSRMLSRKKDEILIDIQNFAEPHSETLIWPESLQGWYAESSQIASTRVYPAYKNSAIIDADYVAEFQPLSYQLLNRAALRITMLLQYIIREHPQ